MLGGDDGVVGWRTGGVAEDGWRWCGGRRRGRAFRWYPSETEARLSEGGARWLGLVLLGATGRRWESKGARGDCEKVWSGRREAPFSRPVERRGTAGEIAGRPAGPSMEAIQGGLNPVNQDQIEREKMEDIKRRRRGTDFCN